MYLEKMMWGISEMVNARGVQTFTIVFSTLDNLLVVYFWSCKNQSKALIIQKYV